MTTIEKLKTSWFFWLLNWRTTSNDRRVILHFSGMPGQRCRICANSQVKDPSISFHRFPRDPLVRGKWLEVFQLLESDLKPSTRVCSRHFPDGNVKNLPSMSIGKYSIWIFCVALSRSLLQCCY